MRTTTMAFALSLAALTAACSRGVDVSSEAPAPAAAAALDPVGVYDFSVSFGGETRNGTIHVHATADGYGGEARLEGEDEPAVIDSVRVTGNRMIIDATPPGQGVTFELDFTGNAFSGLIFAGDDAIPVTGSKRAS